MKTLSKALAILEELNKTDEPISVSQIDKLLKINTTTVSRLMRVFKEAGYVK